MNDKQFKLMWGIIIAFLLIVLFPPMDVTKRATNGKTLPKWQGLIEWRFIFADSAKVKEEVTGVSDLTKRVYVANHIKYAALTVEFIILGVVAAGLWFTFQRGVKNE